MGRSRSSTRRAPHAYPQGILSVYADGYGFVRTPEGEFFIPEKKMQGAFDGDLVEVSPLPVRGGKQSHTVDPDARRVSAGSCPAARVVRVLGRAHETLVGRYEIAEPFGVVIPLDYRMQHDIFTRHSEHPHIPAGALVRVRITQFPSRNCAATGVIEEVLDEGDARVYAVDALVQRHSLETKFSAASMEQAQKAQLDEDGALRSGYVDLRDRVVFTVDPADARDFDDAVSLEPVNDVERQEKGLPQAAVWRLGVHIADVAHYVPWDSSLDLDARRRATSVYLVDRVIPMLPEALSNELCSLKPNVVRRCMTVDLYLDARAQVLDARLYPALMQSCRRMTYDEVQGILDEAGEAYLGVVSAFASVEERLLGLHELADLRRAARQRRGAPEFNRVEAKVKLDAHNDPVGVELHEKTPATELIEEAMLMANEAVAHYLMENDIPGLFRVHEAPSPLSLASLIPVFEEYSWFGYVDKNLFAEGNTQQIQKALLLSKGRSEQELVSTLTLRAMKRAVYSPTCGGHFGLALDEYLHFTSPIRRYPDLVVHRMLKAHLEKKRLGSMPSALRKAVSAETSQLAWLGEHSSKMERIAEDVSRESHEYMLVEYMQRFLGQKFSAVVSGVVSHGIYVRLDNTAEGLIHLRDLGSEYFMMDGVRHTLTGEESGVCYRLGQRVVVVLQAADPKTRSLVFKLVN